ncbi:MAG: nucleotidyltransferase family protein, partial [Acidimicrobiales bacterium]
MLGTRCPGGQFHPFAVKEPQPHGAIEGGGADEQRQGGRFTGAWLAAEEHLAFGQPDGYVILNIVVDADGDRIPQAPRRGVSQCPGKRAGNREGITLHHGDATEGGVGPVPGDPHGGGAHGCGGDFGRNIRVFGSVARGDATPDSDIDLLVDVEVRDSGLDLIGFAQDLEALLGYRVEVGTSVHEVIRRRVEAQA